MRLEYGRLFIFIMDIIEEWKDVVGYEGLYAVSNLGNIKSLSYWRFITPNNKYHFYKERPLKPCTTKDGYLQVRLSKKNGGNSFLLHRLIAIAFIPNPEKKSEVNHKLGIKNDNRVTELEWVTPKENSHHAHSNNLMKSCKGTKNAAAKLTEIQVLEIRAIGKSKTIKSIAEQYNVDTSTIGRILHNTHWKHLIK